MIKKILAVLLFAAVIFCGAGIAAADGPVTPPSPVSLSVVVMDPGNNYIPEAEVVVIADGTAPQTLKTNTDGSVNFLVYPGEYTVSVAKNGYIGQSKTIIVGSEGANELIQLTKEPPVQLTVTEEDGTPIQNAEVTINSVLAGTTDKYGRLNVNMTRGANNSILVTAVSHVDHHESKYIGEDVTALAPIVLTLAKVNPLILVYNENKTAVPGAAVTIDGKLMTYSDEYGRAQLPPYTAGVSYTIGVSCAGYMPYSDTKMFTTDMSDIVVTLTNEPVPASPIVVTVKTDSKVLPNALVYFDGNSRGITGPHGTYSAVANPGTTIMISASLDGYTGEGTAITVAPGKTNEVTILMKENIPTTLIGIGALAAVIVLLIVILIIVGCRKRSKKSSSNMSGGNSHGPRQRRDSL